MKSKKLAVVVVGILGLVFGLSLDARGGGSLGLAPCHTDTASGPVMTGTGAVTITNQTAGSRGDVSATLRLEWRNASGDQAGFFRVHVKDVDLITPEDVLCAVIAAPVPGFATLESKILNTFGIDPTKKLKITDAHSTSNVKSISAQSLGPVPGTVSPGSPAGESSSIADLKLFVQ